MSPAYTAKLLVLPISFVVAVLLAVGCLATAQLYRTTSMDAARFLRTVSYGWFVNALYLQFELARLVPDPRLQQVAASPLLRQSIVTASGIASVIFLAASERYLTLLRRSVRVYGLALLTLVATAPLFMTADGAVDSVVFALNVLLNFASILALAYAFRKLIRDELRLSSRQRHLLVWPLLGYAFLQASYYPIALRAFGVWTPRAEAGAFATAVGLKMAHMVGLVMLGFYRVRQLATEEARIRQEEEELRTFVGELVHELQTPAAHLVLQLEQLETSVLRRQNIREETRMTASVVRQILAIVRAAYDLRQPGAFTETAAPAERLNINHVIQAAYMGVKAAVKKPPGAISFQTQYAHEPDVHGSRSRLFQLFSNLLKNSIDAFTTGKGVIRVTTAKRNGRVVVTITDDGEGIPIEELQRVRERGFTTRLGPGRGNGLFIADLVVQEHDGSLEITSPIRDGHGTQIAITFPAAEWVENKWLQRKR